jgi:hypothetical protein
MGTGSFPGVKWPGRGADHPPPSSAGVNKGESHTSNHPLACSGLYRACFTLPFTVHNTVHVVHLTVFVVWEL